MSFELCNNCRENSKFEPCPYRQELYGDEEECECCEKCREECLEKFNIEYL